MGDEFWDRDVPPKPASTTTATGDSVRQNRRERSVGDEFWDRDVPTKPASTTTAAADPYRTLDLSRTATADEIKGAFRRLAKETHPDLHGGSTEYAERFRAVTDAYAVLSDPVQRRRFDERGSFDQERVAAAREEIYAVIAYVRSAAAEAKATAGSAALRGLAWLVAGLLITVFGYSAAATSGGGSYPICWGAILFGAIQAFRGFAVYLKIDARARELERQVWSTVTDGVPPSL